jgi:hypothetical protein
MGLTYGQGPRFLRGGQKLIIGGGVIRQESEDDSEKPREEGANVEATDESERDDNRSE